MNLDTVVPMPPYTTPTHLVLNTKQVEIFDVEDPAREQFRKDVEGAATALLTAYRSFGAALASMQKAE